MNEKKSSEDRLRERLKSENNEQYGVVGTLVMAALTVFSLFGEWGFASLLPASVWAVLGYGIHKHSRLVAAVALLIFVGDLVVTIATLPRLSVLFIVIRAMVFLFLYRGMRGVLVYHETKAVDEDHEQ